MRRIVCVLTGFGLTLALVATGCKHVPVGPDGPSNVPPTQRASAVDRQPESEPDFDAIESADACIAVASELEKAGRDKEAIALYQRALTFNPAHKNVVRRLACLSARIGQDDSARTHFEAALIQSPRDARLINDFGYFLFSRGEYKAAEKQQRRAIKLAPKSELFKSNLAMTLAAMRQYDESLEVFEHLVGPAAARSNVAVLMARNGDTDRAETILKDAQVLDPSITQTEIVAAWLTTESDKEPQSAGALQASFECP